MDYQPARPLPLGKPVAQSLIDAGRPGRIINIASAGAFFHDGGIPVSFYNITKAALTRMSEVLAVEWAPHHINVNTIAPGFFRLEMNTRTNSDLTTTPRGRMGQPEQLDSTLLYLVDPASNFVTGTCIRVDDCQHPR